MWSMQVLEGRAYRLVNPWVGVVNRSQADINRNVDIVAARRREREYFQSSPDYGHLASRMGSEYLAKLLSKVSMPSILLLLALLCASSERAFKSTYEEAHNSECYLPLQVTC